MHGEQPAADQVGLGRLAQPQPDVGFPHPEVQFLVGQDHVQADIRIEFEELAEPRREPAGAKPERRGDAQLAMRLFTAVHEVAAHRVELEHHILHGAEQQFALLGQDQAARVAMEQARFRAPAQAR